MKKLYEYAIVLHEKVDSKGAPSGKAEILVTPELILADDDGQATLLAGRAIPEEHLDHLERVVVAVRGF